jgi:hypothetical protein
MACVKRKFIQVFEPQTSDQGAAITYSTSESRKSFSLPRPTEDSKTAPLAVESFAIDPEVYHQRMEMVEALVKKQKDQGR